MLKTFCYAVGQCRCKVSNNSVCAYLWRHYFAVLLIFAIFVLAVGPGSAWCVCVAPVRSRRKRNSPMTRPTDWNDDCWLLVMQAYLRKPVGVKPVYSRLMVDLALELHVEPRVLFARMCAVATLATPALERMWERYGSSPRRLARAAAVVRGMRGFGNAGEFYAGVAVSETFERDFRPVEGAGGVTPVALVLVLDLYFRLTPATMVAQTPEVAALARLLGLPVATVVEAMAAFRHCDPFLRRKAPGPSPMLEACREVWRRYGNASPAALASYASQLREYYR